MPTCANKYVQWDHWVLASRRKKGAPKTWKNKEKQKKRKKNLRPSKFELWHIIRYYDVKSDTSGT